MVTICVHLCCFLVTKRYSNPSIVSNANIDVNTYGYDVPATKIDVGPSALPIIPMELTPSVSMLNL